MTTIGNPAPLGLLAFGMTTAMLMYVEMGWVSPAAEVMIFGYAVFLGGLCQLLVGIFELLKGASFPFAVFGCYGSFWLAWAIVFLEKARNTSNFGEASYSMGHAAVMAQWGFLTTCFFVITLRKNLCLVIVFALLAITFFLLAAASGTGSTAVKTAAGYVGFFTAISAFYTGIAELINEEWGRHVLPGLRSLHTPERDVLTSKSIRKRISYDSRSNTMLLYFRSLHIKDMACVDAVREGVCDAIKSAGSPEDRVHAVVDYKGAFIADEIASAYWKMVAQIQAQHYLSVRRFDTTAFGTNCQSSRCSVIPGAGLSNVHDSAEKKRAVLDPELPQCQ